MEYDNLEIDQHNQGKAKRRRPMRPVFIIALSFIGVIAVGAFLLALPLSSSTGVWTNGVDALFTATSAVCVTGLAIFNTGVYFSAFGQVVLLLLIQIGGLGFMTLTTLVFILVGKKISLKERLLIQESFNQPELRGLIRTTTKIIVATFAIELVGAIMLAITLIPTYGWGKGIWFSVFHSVSAFCNAGFDILGIGNSLTIYQTNLLVNLPIMMLIISGGLGFSVLLDIAKNKFNIKHFSVHAKAVLSITGILILGGFLFFLFVEWNNKATIGDMSVGGKMLASLFQSVTPRTAGFNTIDQAGLRPASQLMTVLLMFVGASPGGTGGGVKTITMLVVFMVLISGIKGSEEATMFKHSVKTRVAYRAVALFIFALLLISVVTLSISAIESALGNSFTLIDTLYETTSAFATVGLSTGITSKLCDASLILLSIVMYIGRLGSITFGLFFLGKGASNSINIKYPDFKIFIG